jgi:predicted enzyme related to lactoylglutathione lyase
MSERETYPAGVPCWVDILQRDTEQGRAFYGGRFNWDFTRDAMSGSYFVAQVNGRDVAGLGSLPHPYPASAGWNTYVRVETLSASVERALRTGGRVLVPPAVTKSAGRWALIADPVGASVGLWEAGTREGAQLVNARRAWALSTLHTTDPDASKAFYSEMFGWEAEDFGSANTGITLWHLPGYFGGVAGQPVARDVIGLMVAVGDTRTAHNDAPCWSVDFWVDSADRSAEDGERLGGSVIAPPQDSPGFRSAELADPSGAKFTISQVVDHSATT